VAADRRRDCVRALVACTGGPAPVGSGAPKDKDEVVVSATRQSRDRLYDRVGGLPNCLDGVPDRGQPRVIRHRSDCGLALAGQAPLIGKLLRRVMAADAEAAGFRTLSWGRLYPDGARDTTMPARLALAAVRSADWDTAKGARGRGREWVGANAGE